MSKTKFSFMLAGILLCAVSCSKSEPDAAYRPISLTPEQTRVANENNNFAFRLLQATAPAESNITECPVGTAIVLSMLANGAEGETRSQILDVLGMNDIEDTNSFYRIISSKLPKADNRVQLSLANSLWLDNSYTVKESYSSIMKKEFNAGIYTDNLNTDKAKDRINRWCADATNANINDFLKEPIRVIFAAFNATYFNGQWKEPFKRENTVKKIFHNQDGSEVKADMMCRTENMFYNSAEHWESIKIPYGNGTFLMEVIMAKNGYEIDDALEALVNGEAALEEESGISKIILSLPKFRISGDLDLIPALNSLGMSIAFERDLANFSNISNDPLFLGLFQQNVMIDVNEEGTEAAAVTMGAGYDASAALPPSVTFTVDRPFIYAIRECSTHTILFTGMIRTLK